MSDFPRVSRLDAAAAVDRIAAVHGVSLTIEGPCRGGEVGAVYVRWPDGRRGVLTSGSADAAGFVAVARRAGIPAPRYDLVSSMDGRTIVIQECLPGAPPTALSADLLGSMIALSDRFAGLLPDNTDSISLHLRSSGPGFCLHEPLAAYDAATNRLLTRVRSVGAIRDTADGPDLVHLDFHPENMLVTDGVITGLVDWDGAGAGDRRLDLVTLRFDLAVRAPALGQELEDLLFATVPAERLAAYWSHMGLRLVDWSIRHHTPADVGRWLALANSGLDRLDG